MVKTVPIPCTKEEINALIKEAEDNDFYFTLFYVAKTTGRRLGEYYLLKVKDIDFEKNIMLTTILKKRREAQKEAVLTEEAARVLKQFISRNKLKNEDYVFHKVCYRSIQYAVASYAKKAGIPHRVSFHNFRHYFITELVRLGWPYDKIVKLTGHSSPSTLVFYDHAVASDIKADALEALKDI